MTEILFADGNTLWETDGTPAGTHQVSPQTVTTPQFFNVGGKVLFESDGFQLNFGGILVTRPDEIWVTDGTASGTQRLATNLYQPGGLNTIGIGPSTAVVNGTLFFSASDNGTHGVELWESDGTTAGTHMVKDIASHYADSSNPSGLTSFNGALYFVANDRTVGYELWRSDGTSAGTQPVTDPTDPTGAAFLNTSAPVLFDGELFFVDGSNRNGIGLWKTDGTAAGTQLLFGGIFNSPIATSGHLFFTDSNQNLWASDGTSAGTKPVLDGSVLPQGKGPQQLTAVGSELFFTAADGTHGLQLWDSDGTDVGTHELTLVNTATTQPGLNPASLTAIGDKLFFTGTDGSHGTQLWVSDGTGAGTRELTTAGPGAISDPTNVNGTLFFVGEDGHGLQIWVSDGTAAGTHAVTGFPEKSNYYLATTAHLSAVGNQLFFDASDGNGEHAFVTDGTNVTQLTTGSSDVAAGNFFAIPTAPPTIVVPPGSAEASFDTTQDLTLDLSQADQPHNFVLSGNDTIIGGIAASTIFGTAGNDLVNLSASDTGGMWFIGQAGNDTMNAAAGINSLTGGTGSDVFNVTGGAQWITTGSGTATMNISGGDDTVEAVAGNSTIAVNNASLLLGVIGGNHQVSLVDGAPIVVAVGGTSTIAEGGAAPTPIVGVFGGSHQINGGDGAETVFGMGGNATVTGAAGTEAVDLVAGSVQVNAGIGITELIVNGGDNTLLVQSNGGPVAIAGFDPAHLHLDIASHINGQIFTDPAQIPTSHTADGSLLLDLGAGAHGEELVLLVGVSSIPASAVSFV